VIAMMLRRILTKWTVLIGCAVFIAACSSFSTLPGPEVSAAPNGTDQSLIILTPTQKVATPSYTATAISASPTVLLPPTTFSAPTWTPGILAPTSTVTPTKTPPAGWIVYDVDAIEIIHTSGIGRRLINPNLLHIQDIDWSPDGQQIAVFGKTDWYGHSEIHLLLPDGSGLQRLTYLRSELRCVSWSRTGKYLGFTTDTDIFRYEFDPPRIRKLTPETGLSYPCIEFSTQSDELVYKDQNDLWVMNDDGTNQRILIENIEGLSGFKMSPDSSKVVLVVYNNKDRDLYVIDTDGSNLMQLTSGPHTDWMPSWSPDGEWIVFHRTVGSGGIGDLFFVRADGQGLTQLTFRNEYQTLPTWSPLPGLEPGKGFTVTGLGAGVRLRTSHHLQGEILRQLKRGNEIVVLDGPVEEDDYLWFRVRVEGSQEEGWVIDNPGWWQPAGAGTVR
jgi:TolB protein